MLLAQPCKSQVFLSNCSMQSAIKCEYAMKQQEECPASQGLSTLSIAYASSFDSL